MNGDHFGPDHRCFGCGPRHAHGLRLEFRVEGEEVVTEMMPTQEHESVPNVMHGGLVTTLADELGGWVLIALLDKFGFTGSMSSRFVSPVRVGVLLEGRGRIVRNSRRLVEVRVEVSQQGRLCFKSDITFVMLDEAGSEKMLGGPVPDGWKRFFRRDQPTQA